MVLTRGCTGTQGDVVDFLNLKLDNFLLFNLEKMVEIKDVDDDAQYETESDYSETDAPESLYERLIGLTDAFPVSLRLSLLNKLGDGFAFGLGMAQVIGNIAWVLTTASMVLVLPAALEIEKEHAGLMQEHQARLSQQQAQETLEGAK